MVYDKNGKRKYLTSSERRAFLKAANLRNPQERTFCLMLAYTGARISEVLAIAPMRIDLESSLVVIESMKKRRMGIYRAVPIPLSFVILLEEVHGVSTANSAKQLASGPLWPWSRTKAWAITKAVMCSAGIAPNLAVPKALRHAFGVGATQKNVPLNIVQKWMGHSRISTTALYADAVGDEERAFADRQWTED